MIGPQSVSGRPPRLFRLRSQRILFTFPRCTVDPKLVLQRAVEELPTLKWIIVSREKHGDEGLHLHGILYFNAAFETRRSDCFDFLTGKHGDYKPIKGKIGRTIQYVIKDGEYVEHNVSAKDMIAAMKAKGSYSWLLLYRDLKEGKTLDQLFDDERSGPMVLRCRRQCEWGIAYCQKRRRSARVSSWKRINVEGLFRQSKVIAQWLNSNVRVPRTFKQPQLYIHGPPGKGKTHLVEILRSYLSVYSFPKKRYHDLWMDGVYDIAVLDEYKGEQAPSELNEFLQGSSMYLDQKFAGVMKHQNIPMIILSMYSLEDLLELKKIDLMEYKAFYARLLVVEVKQEQCRIDVFPRKSSKKVHVDELVIPSSISD